MVKTISSITTRKPRLSNFDSEEDEVNFNDSEGSKDNTDPRAKTIPASQANVRSRKPLREGSISQKVKKAKKGKENIRPGALLTDNIRINSHMVYSRLSRREYKLRCKNLKKTCSKSIICNAHISFKNLSKISETLREILAQRDEISTDWYREKSTLWTLWVP